MLMLGPAQLFASPFPCPDSHAPWSAQPGSTTKAGLKHRATWATAKQEGGMGRTACAVHGKQELPHARLPGTHRVVHDGAVVPPRGG